MSILGTSAPWQVAASVPVLLAVAGGQAVQWLLCLCPLPIHCLYSPLAMLLSKCMCQIVFIRNKEPKGTTQVSVSPISQSQATM